MNKPNDKDMNDKDMNNKKPVDFYNLQAETVFKIVNSSPEGLPSEEARQRLIKTGLMS